MNLVKRTLVVAAGAATAAGLLAGPASAATTGKGFVPPFTTATATTLVSTWAAGNGGPWAQVTVNRTATVTGGTPAPTFFCGSGAVRCYSFRATLQDHGMFTTLPNAFTPNQYRHGRRIHNTAHGRVNGTAASTPFYASALPDSLNVPGAVSGAAGSPAAWPERFFPMGTKFSAFHMSPFTFIYTAASFCGPQTWTDASWNGFGNLRQDGNITGCW